MKKLIIEDDCHHRKQAYMLRIHSKLIYPTPVRTAKIYKTVDSNTRGDVSKRERSFPVVGNATWPSHLGNKCGEFS